MLRVIYRREISQTDTEVNAFTATTVELLVIVNVLSTDNNKKL